MSQKHEHEPKRSIPLWARWFIALVVFFILIGGMILWIIQGNQSVFPIAVLSTLGILFAFFQVFPFHMLFSGDKQKHSPTATSPPLSNNQTSFPLSLSSGQPHSADIDKTFQIPAAPSTAIQTAVTQQNLVETLKIDWNEAPYIKCLYGRDRELAKLSQWIIDDHCKAVTLVGMGGIGKTTLAITVTKQLKDKFDYIFWRSLQNAPSLKSILANSILFLSDQQNVNLPKDIDEQIVLLIKYLQKQRCLLILDNFDTLMKKGKYAGQYREGYDGYGRLVHRISEADHQGCLLLTSREKPKEIAYLEGKFSMVRSLLLSGVEQLAVQEILQGKELFGSNEAWATLTQFYSGNPLALKLYRNRFKSCSAVIFPNFLRKKER